MIQSGSGRVRVALYTLTNIHPLWCMMGEGPCSQKHQNMCDNF